MRDPRRLAPLAPALGLLLVCAAPLRAQRPDLYDLDTVRDLRLTFAQSNWWSQLQANKRSRTDLRADLAVDGHTYKDVGVRFRGNTSYSYNIGRSEKLPFNIRTDAFVPNQELYGYTNLNLQNAYKDATFLREPISYLLMRRHLPSLKANWVKLWINDVYWGVYVNIEQPSKGFLRDWFEDEDGNLYRGDSPQRNTRPTLTYLGNSVTSYQSLYDHKTESHPRPWVDLINLCHVLDTTPIAQLPVELPKVLNVDRALWYLALQNITSNTDSYIGTGNDYLVYHDETHGRFQVLPWDLNTTFGGYDWPGGALGVQGLKRMDPFYDGGPSLRRPLESQLWAVPKWRERYLAHFRTMLADWFDWAKLEPLLRKYHAMLDPHVRADTKKLYSTQQFLDNLTRDVVVSDRYGSYTIPGLKDFVDTKRALLLGHAAINKTAPSVSDLARTPAEPGQNDTVWVTAKISGAASALLYWRVTGPFLETPMFDDGKHGDGQPNDGVWGTSIPAQIAGRTVDYYVGAETAANVQTFAPALTTGDLARYRVRFQTGASPLRINEVIARNTRGARDESNELEDWLEIVNTGTQELDVAGMYLTDTLAKPTKWKIPAGTKIKAGGTLLFWADEQGSQGPLHLNFKLSAGGEELALFDRDGKTLLDTVAFGPQQDDVSLGRLYDGKLAQAWVTFPVPTPNAVNAPSTCGTRAYSAANPFTNAIQLGATGAPKIAANLQLGWQNGAPHSAFVHLFAATSAILPLDDRLAALIGPPLALFVVPSDAQGAATLPLAIPDNAALVGQRVYMQSLGIDARGLFGSNALEVTVCPK